MNGKTFFFVDEVLASELPKDRKIENTTSLTFSKGEANPLVFLEKFEALYAIKSDQEKIRELRHFVDREDIGRN